MSEELIYETTDDISNRTVELEKEIMALEEEEFKLAYPLMKIRFEIAQRKRLLSIANKEYWRAVK